jgi:hypothetical protein
MPTLTLTCPEYAVTSLRWVCENFLEKNLNAHFVVRAGSAHQIITIELAGKIVAVNNVFFHENPFNKRKYLVTPHTNLDRFSSLNGTSIPILFGRNEINENDDGLYLGMDLLGGIFFLVSRYEEYFLKGRDQHDRFPAIESTTYQYDFLNLPLANEYTRLLCRFIQQVWPQIKLKTRTPRIFVTCDVDNPYALYASSLQKTLWKCSGDLVKRKNLSDAVRTIGNYWRTSKGDYSADPNNTFDWIMDVNEKAGNRVAFYFLVDRTVPEFDAHYGIDEPRIRALMRRIHDRGHEIGLHASYGTYRNPVQMKKEADKLRQVMDEEGIKQDEIGSRQHYLRWSTPETARHLEAAGIAYDTTLGFADHAGFRCGTCHEFPMFDVERQKALKLRQRPLILMEASVLSQKYMNMGYSVATLDYMKQLKTTCHEHGGTFTLLWHNSHLRTENDRRFYQELIA